jgi:nucleoid DNA-binding protein
MNIAHYIGLFLLKNEYCYLPGIGSLQIEKIASVYDKEAQQLTAPKYEIKYRVGVGSIDDSFANFIANNERISIAHAANHLKDFCAHAKQSLLAGEEVIIPGVGKFHTINGHTALAFTTDANLHIEGKSIPYFKNNTAAAKEADENKLSSIIERTTFKEPKADDQIEYQAPKVNWGKIIILSSIVLAILAGIIYLFIYLNKDNNTPSSATQETEQNTEQINAEDPETNSTPALVNKDSIVTTDTNNVASTAVTTTPTANGSTLTVALHEYPTLARAEARVAKLKSFGNSSVAVVTKDETHHLVTIQVPNTGDATRVVDSLRKLFNPTGNVVLLP